MVSKTWILGLLGLVASGAAYANEYQYTVCVVNDFTRPLSVNVDNRTTVIIPNQAVVWRLSSADSVLAKFDANQFWKGQNPLILTETLDAAETNGLLCIQENTWSLVAKGGYITLEKLNGVIPEGPFGVK